ncbi:hypothetical protein SAMN02746095_02896 [Acidocella aminolytica 101 = DSM 11237]|uniref:Uncharacterized protein n=1 Tax=Acidocella aminolytica 101 = DSM 11237 TaxID=1120923 RepID=A0A0D6PDW7_9PROT|nr:hypothetical protein Aam_022_033 [Acidocella aminolytica 101 = DSM 11237]SHF34019.1 hypothetical protein SAMN02746095_02896 [Acidocella aminolytica 101 = DSM 11237]
MAQLAARWIEDQKQYRDRYPADWRRARAPPGPAKMTSNVVGNTYCAAS